MLLTQFDWKSFGPLHPVLIKRTRNLLSTLGLPSPQPPHPTHTLLPAHRLAKQLAVMPYLFWKDAGSGPELGLALLDTRESAGLLHFVLLSSGFGRAGAQASTPFRPPSVALLTQGSHLLGLSRFKNHKTGGEHILLVQLPASDLLERPCNWPGPDQLHVELEDLRKPRDPSSLPRKGGRLS